VKGTGPRQRHFDESDRFTKVLQDHYHVQYTRKAIGNDLLSGKLKAGGDWSVRKHELGKDNEEGTSIEKLRRDFSTNSSAALLGSYNLKYRVVGMNKATGYATVRFWVHNESNMNSATHPHPSLGGYSEWWNKKIRDPLNKDYSTGRFSPKTQDVMWTEAINVRSPLRP
jgi:hypothetical protein